MKRKCFERILSAVFIAILAFANYACDNKEEIPPRDKEKQENKLWLLWGCTVYEEVGLGECKEGTL